MPSFEVFKTSIKRTPWPMPAIHYTQEKPIYMNRPSYLLKSAFIFPILLNLLSKSCCCPCCSGAGAGAGAGDDTGTGTYSLACCPCADPETRLCCCCRRPLLTPTTPKWLLWLLSLLLYPYIWFTPCSPMGTLTLLSLLLPPPAMLLPLPLLLRDLNVGGVVSSWHCQHL